MELSEFLLARVAEDEERAHSRQLRPHLGDCNAYEANAGYDACDCNYPARVLAECTVKRGLIEYARPDEADLEGALAEHAENPVLAAAEPIARVATRLVDEALAEVLKYLAFAYADHPDYRPEWKP